MEKLNIPHYIREFVESIKEQPVIPQRDLKRGEGERYYIEKIKILKDNMKRLNDLIIKIKG